MAWHREPLNGFDWETTGTVARTARTVPTAAAPASGTSRPAAANGALR